MEEPNMALETELKRGKRLLPLNNKYSLKQKGNPQALIDWFN